jgi:hypothetical protein
MLRRLRDRAGIYFAGAVIDHRLALTPNSNFVIKNMTPNNITFSPFVVGRYCCRCCRRRLRSHYNWRSHPCRGCCRCSRINCLSRRWCCFGSWSPGSSFHAAGVQLLSLDNASTKVIVGIQKPSNTLVLWMLLGFSLPPKQRLIWIRQHYQRGCHFRYYVTL